MKRRCLVQKILRMLLIRQTTELGVAAAVVRWRARVPWTRLTTREVPVLVATKQKCQRPGMVLESLRPVTFHHLLLRVVAAKKPQHH